MGNGTDNPNRIGVAFKTVRDIDWSGRQALVRVDFNVPLDREGAITDDSRILASVPTIRYLLDHGASVCLMSHLGRPRSKEDAQFTLAPVADRLGRILGCEVPLIKDLSAPSAMRSPGAVTLLENTRFEPGETGNDPAFAQVLSRFGNVYVNDAFGSLHRAHASTEGVGHLLPAVAGLLVETELHWLSPLLDNPQRPALAIMGGAKISDKVGVIRNLLRHMDDVLVGGGMANTFLAAQGLVTGKSLVQAEALDTARSLLADFGNRLHLPVDLVVAKELDSAADRKTVPADGIEEDWMALDIGPATVAHYANRLAPVHTVFWNGPMGVCEVKPFDNGTNALAEILGGLPDARSVVGGGDGVAAIRQAGMEDAIGHLSTGGGACLEYLAGTELPGLAVLTRSG